MRQGKNKTEAALQLPDANASWLTAKTDSANTSSATNIIPQTPENSNMKLPQNTTLPGGTGAAEAGVTGDTQRGFSKNLAGDKGMNESIREDYQLDPDMYFEKTNKETLSKAQEIFDKGADNARSILEKAKGYRKKPRRD